jgi:hypothetical protein
MVKGTSRLEANVTDACKIIYWHYRLIDDIARKFEIKEWSNTDCDFSMLEKFILRVQAERNKK